MKRAQGVIMVMTKRNILSDAQWRFLSHIKQAVNNDAQLNNEQEDFLLKLVDAYDYGDSTLAGAIAVATWINSCR